MKNPDLVQGKVELNAGNMKFICGKVDPGRTLAPGSLGVYFFRPNDSRGKAISDMLWAVIPWSQVKILHLDGLNAEGLPSAE